MSKSSIRSKDMFLDWIDRLKGEMLTPKICRYNSKTQMPQCWLETESRIQRQV